MVDCQEVQIEFCCSNAKYSLIRLKLDLEDSSKLSNGCHPRFNMRRPMTPFTSRHYRILFDISLKSH